MQISLSSGKSVVVLALCLGAVSLASAQRLFRVTSGSIAFTSEAPLELIKAKATTLKGVFDPAARTCAFTIMISEFQGFNSPLQQVHFNENYLESSIYPEASFTGKIIEDVDLTKPGRYEVRVKGNLTIHGVRRERIIRGTIDIGESEMDITCAFPVLLQDHDIRIPKVVRQKIAETIDVVLIAALRAEP